MDERTPALPPGAATVDKSILAEAADVESIEGKGGATLIDARPASFFLGKEKAPASKAYGHIPGALNIPLPQLRGRLDELRTDREWIVHCQSGQRSYFACRLLQQKGYRCRNLAGSYRTWKNATTPA